MLLNKEADRKISQSPNFLVLLNKEADRNISHTTCPERPLFIKDHIGWFGLSICLLSV